MRSSKTPLASQPPAIHRMFEILGPVLRAVSLTKVICFQWRKNFHTPNKEFRCAVAKEFMVILVLGVLTFHSVGVFDVRYVEKMWDYLGNTKG